MATRRPAPPPASRLAPVLAVLAAACLPPRAPHPRAVEELRRGYAHLAAGERERAEVAFAHALEIEPGLPEARNALGLAVRLDGRAEAARAWWEAAAADGLAEARSNLGAALAESGRDRDALEAFSEALAFDPDLLAPRLGRARVQLRRALAARGAERAAGLAHARRDLLHAVEAGPDRPEPHRDLGYVAWAQGDLELSAASYGRAAALDPGDAGAHHGLCAALALLGRCAEAREACLRCLGVDPRQAGCAASLAGAAACAAAAPKDDGAPGAGAPSTSAGLFSGDLSGDR